VITRRKVEQYTAPRWPDRAYPQQIHLDVTVQDVDAAERAVLDIGATRLDGAGPNWRVYADPVGKPLWSSVDGLEASVARSTTVGWRGVEQLTRYLELHNLHAVDGEREVVGVPSGVSASWRMWLKLIAPAMPASPATVAVAARLSDLSTRSGAAAARLTASP